MIRFTINHTKGESIISIVLKNIPSIGSIWIEFIIAETENWKLKIL